jgi:hypothetical protein
MGGGGGTRQSCHFPYMFVQYKIDTHSAHLFVYVLPLALYVYCWYRPSI